MTLWVNVIKPFGYYDWHEIGDKFRMPLRDVTDCAHKGYVEIIVNNVGNNSPYDEDERNPFEIPSEIEL